MSEVSARKTTQGTATLKDFVEKLNNFDAESIFNKIKSDIRTKYDLAIEHYKEIELLRSNLTYDARKVFNKLDLANKLDAVVPTLRKDFTKFTEAKYQLLDEIFLIKTNHIEWDEDELNQRVEHVLQQPERIYAEEFAKIEKIYSILDEEGCKLEKLIK